MQVSHSQRLCRTLEIDELAPDELRGLGMLPG